MLGHILQICKVRCNIYQGILLPLWRGSAHLCTRDTENAGERGCAWLEGLLSISHSVSAQVSLASSAFQTRYFPPLHLTTKQYSGGFRKSLPTEQSSLGSAGVIRLLASSLHTGSARGKPALVQEPRSLASAVPFLASLGTISPG